MKSNTRPPDHRNSFIFSLIMAMWLPLDLFSAFVMVERGGDGALGGLVNAIFLPQKMSLVNLLV